MNRFNHFLTARLKEIEAAGLKRSLRRLESPQGPEVQCNGRKLLNFSSNDYLGLADHPSLRDAARAALGESGSGSGASRLICGNHSHHEALEAALAGFKRTEAALTFSTGYAAALGTITALVGEGDVVILDKLCHASLVDGARLSGATIRVYPHNNLEKLASHLQWAREKYPSGRVLVVTESVFSMDGDRAPLADIVALKDQHQAWLFLDEAHAVGVIGSHGRGLADELGLASRVEVQMGTLGKALGSAGAYICGSAVLRDFLINRARSFIFSTAPPPHVAASACAAVQLLETGEGAALVKALWDNLSTFTSLMGGEAASSAIHPLILGPEDLAMEASRELEAGGFLVPAIRFPTVARGAARLRVVITAVHQRRQIESLVKALEPYRAPSR